MSSYDRQRSRSRDRYDADHKGSQDYYNDRNYDRNRKDSRDYGRDRGETSQKENRGFANYGAIRDDHDDNHYGGDHYGRGNGRRDDLDDRRDGGDHYGKKRGRSPPPSVSQSDDKLPALKDDPRINAGGVKEGGKAVKAKGGGRNTESFDPRSTLVALPCASWLARTNPCTINLSTTM